MTTPRDPNASQPPILEPATPRRPTWQRRVAVVLSGAVAVLALGAGFGVYLVLLDHGRSWRHHTIVHEVQRPAAPAPAPAALQPVEAPIELAFVAHADRPWALLDLGFDPAWARGQTRALPPGDDDFIALVTREVDIGAVPDAAIEALGSELTLYGEDGELCRARVARLAALGRYADGGFVGGQADRWELAAGSHTLAAELLPVAGDCAEARWARSSALPAPEVAEVVIAPDSLAAQAVDAFRRRGDYRALQREHEAEGGSGPWDQFEGGEVDVKLVRGSGTALVVAEAQVGGCGTFEGALVSLWRLEAGGELVPISLAGERPPLGIDAAADLDFDGQPELFYRPDDLGDAVLRGSAKGYREAEAAEVPYYGCRC